MRQAVFNPIPMREPARTGSLHAPALRPGHTRLIRTAHTHAAPGGVQKQKPCSSPPPTPPPLHTQNAEVLTLTYGALVRQLVADLDDVDAVNRQLDQM